MKSINNDLTQFRDERKRSSRSYGNSPLSISNTYGSRNPRKKAPHPNKFTKQKTSTTKKISIGAFFLIITTLGFLGFISINGYSTTNGNNTFGNGEINNSKKIGVFFWASDALQDDSIIYEYVDVLKKEGFTSFFYFKDTNNYKANFDYVDSQENSTDTIFIYIQAHGTYYETTNNSFCDLGYDFLTSEGLRTELEDLEAQHIGFLVESCKSGEFVNKVRNTRYLAMSSSDISKFSSGYASTGEGKFSDMFFDGINDGRTAESAYWKARSTWVYSSSEYQWMTMGVAQNPLYYNGDSYSFF